MGDEKNKLPEINEDELDSSVKGFLDNLGYESLEQAVMSKLAMITGKDVNNLDSVETEKKKD